MAQFWQRQKIYAQVTALGRFGGRWRSHHVRPRLRQIAPRNYAKQFRALHRNRLPVGPNTGPELPGSGAGLIGLQERVTLAGGTLVHGPDGAGDFVVHAELPW